MNEPAPARRDVIGGVITAIAILMFIGTGGAALSMILTNYLQGESGANQTLVIALLLNVALILFGWRRHRDITRDVLIRQSAEDRASNLATRDPLTGFLNRRSLSEQGAALLTQAERRHKAVALLMLDIDHFKTVNDMHGNAAGDATLREVAAGIVAALPQGALTARFGGDEFACVLLFDSSNPDSIERIAERLIHRLGQPFVVDGLHISISASMGIARSDFPCPSIDSLLRAADVAMYAAKAAGRNRHAWFDLSMERELQTRNEMESALRLAIPRQEIMPFFDQQIDLVTNRLTGFEVLARWDHPQRGLMTPDQFVGIAEETGMIADLSMSVMRQAFLAARDWDPSLTLSVNISPWQLRDAWLSQKIIKLLTETGFAANRLEVEITETALFDNLALAQSIVASLKNQGIRLALDDFGTGYSSLAHLRAMPFDRIKIDRSFIQSINLNPESAAIVNAITRLADSLNLPVTAEGVEDRAIEERVRAVGCAQGQGYHYGRPVSAANARRLLAERRLLASCAAEPDVIAPASRHLAG